MPHRDQFERVVLDMAVAERPLFLKDRAFRRRWSSRTSTKKRLRSTSLSCFRQSVTLFGSRESMLRTARDWCSPEMKPHDSSARFMTLKPESASTPVDEQGIETRFLVAVGAPNVEVHRDEFAEDELEQQLSTSFRLIASGWRTNRYLRSGRKPMSTSLAASTCQFPSVHPGRARRNP